VPRHSTAIAFAVASLGIATFSAMDAVMKGLSIGLGAYNAMLWRTLAGLLIAGAVYFARRAPWPAASVLRLHLRRGVLTAVMALLFFWGLARVPLAQGVALSFVAPLIALYLAALLLKEKIERSAVLASLLGFAGVIVILAGQAQAEMGPDAFRGAIAILLSALIYAYNIILMRRQALVAGPVEIAFFMNLIPASCFLLAAPFLAVLPGAELAPHIFGAAALAFASLLLLSWAYARSEAQHLAPVEYTAFVWAAFFGFIVFGESVRPMTLAGAAMIVLACLIAARRRSAPAADVEAAI
jgi:S-adenosylmethionine uptake transporter